MRVLSVGYCTLDQIGLVDRFAENDVKVEMPTFSIQGGGTAATATVALARWGARTQFVGKVADDERGDLIVRTLSDEGVGIDHMVRDAGKVSQVSFVIIEASSGSSHTYYTPGNVQPLRADEIDVTIVDGQDLLLVDGAYPVAQIDLMRRAKEQGIPIIIEATRDRGVTAECVALADVVVASERSASAFTGVGSLQGICEAFLQKGPRTAIVTLGDEGAVAMGSDKELIRVPADDVKVVDLTGAGDIFLGAVGLGLVEGWPLEKTVKYANLAASLSCKGLGGRSKITSRKELEDMLQSSME